MNIIPTQNKKILRDIIILIFASLIPLLWFKKGCFIAGGDIAAYIDLSNYIKFLPYAWDEQVMAGRHNFAVHFLLPYGAFWYLLKSFSIPLNIIQQLWACVTLFISALSMYYLINLFTKTSKSTIGTLLGALFYIINPFVANTPLIVQYNLAPIYMFTPLILAFFIKGLHSKNTSENIFFASLIALTSLLFASASLNITHLFVLIGILLAYLIFYLATNRNRFVSACIFIVLCGILYTAVNFWWISVSFTKMVSMSNTVSASHKGWEVLNATHLSDAFRLLGSWAWRVGHRDMPYFPYAYVYDSWYFLILEWGLVIFIFSALFVQTKKSVFPALLALIGLFLMKGETGPFGFFYKYAWNSLPGFWIFREPFAKFAAIVTLSYGLLLGISCSYYFDTLMEWVNKSSVASRKYISPLKHSFKTIFPAIIITVICLLSFPMFTGECIWDHYNYEMRSLHAKVPQYWHDASNWFEENDPDARILPLPKTGYGKSCFNWESGFTAECSPVKNLFPNPLIYYEDFPHNEYQAYLNNIFSITEAETSRHASDILRPLGITYVVHQKDVDWKFTWPDAISHDMLSERLSQDTGLKKITSFGKLDIYKVTQSLPHIYSTPEATVDKNTKNSLFTLKPSLLKKAPYIFLSEEQRAPEQSNFTTIDTSYPIKMVTKINPSRYIVDIDAHAPFWLIFDNTYSLEWHAYIDQTISHSDFFKKRVFLDTFIHKNTWTHVVDHYVINGYANGWWVTKPGIYKIIIQYGPQYTFEGALYISFTAIIILIVFLLTYFPTRKTK
ncbi:MAG: alpha-(1-_3)-arabinofuranosyltransferase family protein [Candidatus Ancaeobacter aquaticus]|nr:alpha-(1->3)-arabinofuranosyltransferase family protein [Candidatus Ancaeobacter aquaticus]